jgi:integrase
LVPGRAGKTVGNILQTLFSILQTARKFGSAVPAVSRADIVLPNVGVGREARFFDAEQVGRIFHAFRHATASELLEQGAPLTVVQRQLRHRDARTTLQIYGHVVGDAQRRALETLAEKIERYAAIELEPGAEMEPSVT